MHLFPSFAGVSQALIENAFFWNFWRRANPNHKSIRLITTCEIKFSLEQVDLSALADRLYELLAPRLSLLLETSLAPLHLSVAALSARLSSLFPQAAPTAVCLDPDMSASRQGEMSYEVNLHAAAAAVSVSCLSAAAVTPASSAAPPLAAVVVPQAQVPPAAASDVFQFRKQSLFMAEENKLRGEKPRLKSDKKKLELQHQAGFMVPTSVESSEHPSHHYETTMVDGCSLHNIGLLQRSAGDSGIPPLESAGTAEGFLRRNQQGWPLDGSTEQERSSELRDGSGGIAGRRNRGIASSGQRRDFLLSSDTTDVIG
ncbi:hypothetical protein KSP40_PGU015154 [Platanthera guangdongensis]|uniref:Uncharacterized protein n=1 Tax=Platanthera guangdongensis TaxID=2320717 RepID=A0ABR2MUM7_9ASPA